MSDSPDDYDDDYLDDDEFDTLEEETVAIPKSAMRLIEERREQMELERSLRSDFSLDW